MSSVWRTRSIQWFLNWRNKKKCITTICHIENVGNDNHNRHKYSDNENKNEGHSTWRRFYSGPQIHIWRVEMETCCWELADVQGNGCNKWKQIFISNSIYITVHICTNITFYDNVSLCLVILPQACWHKRPFFGDSRDHLYLGVEHYRIDDLARVLVFFVPEPFGNPPWKGQDHRIGQLLVPGQAVHVGLPANHPGFQLTPSWWSLED